MVLKFPLIDDKFNCRSNCMVICLYNRNVTVNGFALCVNREARCTLFALSHCFKITLIG